MTAEKNTKPVDIWDALTRLHNCNRTQLAERLGVSRRTVHLWIAATERGEDPGRNAILRAEDLLRRTIENIRAKTEGMDR